MVAPERAPPSPNLSHQGPEALGSPLAVAEAMIESRFSWAPVLPVQSPRVTDPRRTGRHAFQTRRKR